MSGLTAFVLAGGGSLGAVQVGMLKALTRKGIVPDLLVGASVGALNAACFAYLPSFEGVERLERIWLGLQSTSVFPLSPVNSLLAILGKRDHLISPARLQALIASELPYERIEDARIPLHVVATDVLEGTEVCLSRGLLAPALLASAAIPAIFPQRLNSGPPLDRWRRGQQHTDLLCDEAGRITHHRTGHWDLMRTREATARRRGSRTARREPSGHAPVVERHRALLRSRGADCATAALPRHGEFVRLLSNCRARASRRSQDSVNGCSGMGCRVGALPTSC